METTLYGFTREAIQPRGQVLLQERLGETPLWRVRIVNFLVVDALSTYLGVLGRPYLNLFQVVVSMYHMKLIFPIGEDVGEVVGDQLCSPKCYVEIVKRVVHSSPREKSRGDDTIGNKVTISEAMKESSEF